MSKLIKLDHAVFILIVIFTCASWIDLVGVFAEIPLMVPSLPEGWKLGTYLSIATQVPFLGPIAIFILSFLRPKWISLSRCTFFIILVGGLSLALMAKFWNYTIRIKGSLASFPLLFLITCLGLVDNCSSVVFFPYMKRFHPDYMSALLVGESLTGFIPAFMKVIQGGAEPYCTTDITNLSLMNISLNNTIYFDSIEKYTTPRFSVSVYLGILSVVMFICLFAFIALETVPRFKKTQLPKEQWANDPREMKALMMNGDITPSSNENKMDTATYVTIMALMGITAFFLWGIVSSLYTYSVLPYGFRTANNSLIMTNAIRFSAVIFAYKKPTEKLWHIIIWNAAVTLITTYLLICAIYSPCPPLIDHRIGPGLAIFCMMLIDYCSTYIRSCMVRKITLHGGNSLLICAMITKIGVLIGAVTSTIMVSNTAFFKPRKFCLPLSIQCTGFRRKFLPRFSTNFYNS